MPQLEEIKKVEMNYKFQKLIFNNTEVKTLPKKSISTTIKFQKYTLFLTIYRSIPPKKT